MQGIESILDFEFSSEFFECTCIFFEDNDILISKFF